MLVEGHDISGRISPQHFLLPFLEENINKSSSLTFCGLCYFVTQMPGQKIFHLPFTLDLKITDSLEIINLQNLTLRETFFLLQGRYLKAEKSLPQG